MLQLMDLTLLIKHLLHQKSKLLLFQVHIMVFQVDIYVSRLVASNVQQK